MRFRNSRWLVVALAGLLAGASSLADDIRPESREKPFADEKCIEQCDTKSDECMQASNGVPDKVQVCDDNYTKCLEACEAT